jgi:hypothetical protein
MQRRNTLAPQMQWHGKLAWIELEFRPGRKLRNLFCATVEPNYCVVTFLPNLDLELYRTISSTTQTLTQ